MVILTILILLIHEYSVIFHLFVSSSISFISVSWFSEYRFFTSLDLFLGSLILFDVMVNWIIFLISLSSSSLLVYRNATDFFILIVYPATTPNSLASSHSFLVASLGFSMYSIMSSANSECFTSSLPIWIPFISFS